MKNKIFLSVLSVSLLLVLIGILMPSPDSDRGQFLPWQIEHTAQGATRVFGITLGETTLQTAERQLHGSAEVTMFATPDNLYRVEAYLDKVVLGGFASKMVMVMQLPQEEAEAMFLRGVRISTLGSGTNKVTLSSEDMRQVYATPIASLDYLTRATLDDELLLKRFGEPVERITEPENGTVHWLYPELGLDIALNSKGKGVLQYVLPSRFESLAQPLREMKTVGEEIAEENYQH
jgi:hypothetical protein